MLQDHSKEKGFVGAGVRGYFAVKTLSYHILPSLVFPQLAGISLLQFPQGVFVVFLPTSYTTEHLIMAWNIL